MEFVVYFLLAATVFSFNDYTFVKGLECYVCENCEEIDNIVQLSTCDRQTMSTAVTASASIGVAGKPLDGEQSSNSGTGENSPAGDNNSNNSNSEDYSESDEDDSDEDDRKRLSSLHRKAKANDEDVDPVCYMIKVKGNSSYAINRGCIQHFQGNDKQTCQHFYDNLDAEDCLICSYNGCNRLNALEMSNAHALTGVSGSGGGAYQFQYVMILFIIIITATL